MDRLCAPNDILFRIVTTELTPERARRRASVRLFQKLQHAVPGFVLLSHGSAMLVNGAEGWHEVLAIAEVVTSLIVFAMLARALRALRVHFREGTVPHVHTGIDWVDIFLGAMLFTEVWSRYVETGHIARPTILLGFVMLFFGVFGGRFILWKQGRDDS